MNKNQINSIFIKGVSIISSVICLLSISLTNIKAQTFTFGAAGDYANGTNFRATVSQVKANNIDFMVALGDLAYTTAEQSWCSTWKTTYGYNNILLITGNHDSGESSSGNINTYVQYCPYTLSSPMTGTYGKQYYFDYPTTGPIARFILVSPGMGGSYMSDTNTNYVIGSPGYNFVSSAIDDARAKGIKWIVVGHHKNYISTMEKSNELGPDFMNLLLNKKVDLVLQGHEHGYERSKQLKCAKVNSYDATCVVDSDNNMVKGAGTIIHVIGTGGQGLRSLTTSDSEYPYFMVSDNTTYGFGKFSISPTQMSYRFIKSAGGTLADSFTITDSGITQPTPTPTPAPTITPVPSPSACPAVSTSLGVATFTANAPTTGNYTVWSRIMASATNANSYYLQIDNTCPISVGGTTITQNIWTWINYQNGNSGSAINVNLTAGSHQIKLIGKAANTKIDRLIITNDFNCLPSGTGDNCAGDSIANPKTDINGDGLINIVDIGIIIDNYSKLPITNLKADINSDGTVNIIDIGIIIDNYGL